MAVYSYAEKFLNMLVQKWAVESKSDALTQSNQGVTFLNAQTIKLPRITVSGYKDHTRTPGFNTGSMSNDWEPKKLEFDRDIELWIDPQDIDETNLTLAMANIQNTFEEEQAIPEQDCYRFSKLYAEYADTYNQTVDTDTLDTKTILEKFDEDMCAMDDAGVPEEGRLFYATPAYRKILKEAEGLTRVASVQAGYGGVIDRRVHALDDVSIISVPSARLKTKYDFSNGFVPAEGAKQINTILVHPSAVICRQKYSYIKLFTPGTDSRTADGYLYQNRKYGDLFLLEKRVEGVRINASA